MSGIFRQLEEREDSKYHEAEYRFPLHDSLLLSVFEFHEQYNMRCRESRTIWEFHLRFEKIYHQETVLCHVYIKRLDGLYIPVMISFDLTLYFFPGRVPLPFHVPGVEIRSGQALQKSFDSILNFSTLTSLAHQPLEIKLCFRIWNCHGNKRGRDASSSPDESSGRYSKQCKI